MNEHILARFQGLIQAQAVKAAHGDEETFQDAMQEGAAILLEANARFDPKKGNLVPWLATALMAIRGESRKQAQAATLRLEDLSPAGEDESEPALALGDYDEADPAKMDWDHPLFEISNAIYGNTVESVEDPPASFVRDGDPNTSPFIFISPAPSPLAGQPFTIYGDEEPSLAEPNLREREDDADRTELRCDGWEDAVLGVIAQEIGSTEAWEDRPEEMEPLYAIPGQEQVKADLDAFLSTLKDEGAYIRSRAYQVAFVLATLDGNGPSGCKQAGYQAWLKAKANAKKAGLMHILAQASRTCTKLEAEARLPKSQSQLPGMRKAWKHAHDEARQAQEALYALIPCEL